jgi:hypothetical protein
MVNLRKYRFDMTIIGKYEIYIIPSSNCLLTFVKYNNQMYLWSSHTLIKHLKNDKLNIDMYYAFMKDIIQYYDIDNDYIETSENISLSIEERQLMKSEDKNISY